MIIKEALCENCTKIQRIQNLEFTVEKLSTPKDFEKLYQLRFNPFGVVKSPFNLASNSQIIKLVEDNVEERDLLLDYGVGEGDVTRLFTNYFKKIWGYDFSGTAVYRARNQIPQGTFSIKEEKLQGLNPSLLFFSEIIYYFDNIPNEIQRIVEYTNSRDYVLFSHHSKGEKYSFDSNFLKYTKWFSLLDEGYVKCPGCERKKHNLLFQLEERK